MKFPMSGLYAITQSAEKSCDTIIQEVTAAIKGGACVIQYRDKRVAADILCCATKLQMLCRCHEIPFIINDNIELALQVKASGVHIGKHDGSIRHARKRLGAGVIIGVSCYDDINRAKKAESAGADYVAFGRYFPSQSKPLATPAQQQTLVLAKQIINLPIVAIGGILPENGQQLLTAGADVLAVIGGVFDHNPEQSARHYQTLFHA